MSKVEKIVWDAAEPVAASYDCSIYDVEFVKEGQNYYLRVYIDKDGGISTDDCEKVSRALEPILDKIDPIEQSYYLEISSPGLDRKLSRDEHFAAAFGKSVDIKLFSPIKGSKELTALLTGYKDGVITVKCDDGEIIDIEKQKTSVVRLSVVL